MVVSSKNKIKKYLELKEVVHVIDSEGYKALEIILKVFFGNVSKKKQGVNVEIELFVQTLLTVAIIIVNYFKYHLRGS